MASCRLVTGVAGPELPHCTVRGGDHARSTIPKKDAHRLWHSLRTVLATGRAASEAAQPMRELRRCLREALDEDCAVDSVAAFPTATMQEDAERFLHWTRRKLESGLDDGDQCSSPDSSGSEASEHSVDVQELREVSLRLFAGDVPSRLVACLSALNFEAQKDALRLCVALLQQGASWGIDKEIVEHFKSRHVILKMLLEGSGNPKVAWHCAQILKVCACSPELAAALIEESAVDRLLELMQHHNFDISVEAFSSLQVLLLEQREVSAAYLEANFHRFFGAMHAFLQEDQSYVRQRQALKLLGLILLNQSFMEVMLRYVKNDAFLQIHMQLLRRSSKVVRTDAFHVFKAFVGNPNKPRRVQQILYQNKEKLMLHLATFLRQQGDEGFFGDLEAVIGLVHSLNPPTRHT